MSGVVLKSAAELQIMHRANEIVQVCEIVVPNPLKHRQAEKHQQEAGADEGLQRRKIVDVVRTRSEEHRRQSIENHPGRPELRRAGGHPRTRAMGSGFPALRDPDAMLHPPRPRGAGKPGGRSSRRCRRRMEGVG